MHERAEVRVLPYALGPIRLPQTLQSHDSRSPDYEKLGVRNGVLVILQLLQEGFQQHLLGKRSLQVLASSRLVGY